MGRLTENECMDLFAESLQDDKRKLQSEIARLGAEVVQLKHRLSERADAHDRLRGRAEEAEADLARLRVKYSATHDCKEKAWAEAERLRAERDGFCERAERAERAVKGMVDAFTCDVADWRRSHEAVENARAILDAAPAEQEGGG
jgi:chromosome segregation ATPase